MRNSKRHNSDVPIDIQLDPLAAGANDFLKNVSQGGLAFHAKSRLETGTIIQIKIPLVDPDFQSLGRVTWCRPNGTGNYEVGVEFLDDNNTFRVRMVEQICQIERYKQQVFEQEGRVLSGEQAAAEWISKFAKRYPNSDDK